MTGKKLSNRDAILEAGRLRLRPVLMTAFSTIFGMIPIALATSDGAEFRNSMGVIVIGGLLSSTLLTLFVVPTVYTLFGDIRVLSRRSGTEATPEEAPRIAAEPVQP